jgi:hypothetical protein
MLTTAKTEVLVNLEQPPTKLLAAVEPRVTTSLTVGYQIAHQTPWYLRLKVARLGEDAEYAQRPIALATAIAFKTTMVLSI